MKKSDQWSEVLENIRSQVSAGNFHTWFARAISQQLKDGGLLIRVPSTIVKENISIKYRTILDTAIEAVYGKGVSLDFKVDPSLDSKTTADTDEEEDFFIPSISAPAAAAFGLNIKYTLKNFVVGLSNNLAYAAAQAVVQNPGISYNPLFIYGGTGVGKTHLMQGIGNALLEKNSRLKIIYCSSEKFMNDFVQGIQTKRTGDFRARYRSCDLLLIDDIQFISGRDAMQEEFFHTFNELQTKNTQVVLTSDRPPNEIQKLEPRLASRFQGGLMVDIQLPDFDTRVAILKARCAEQGEEISEEILTLIAENMPTNARELEGKFLQIVQSAKLLGQTLTTDIVRNYLGKNSPLPAQNQKPDHKKVLSEVNQYFNIKMADITGPRRKKELVLPRQLAMYLMYEECKLPYEKIGELLGGRDHTTIMHGVEKIGEAVSRDREVQRMLIEIKQCLVN